MTERKNKQTVTKWVAKLADCRYVAEEFAPYGTADPRYAFLYDSPTDVPDDCTPVRVRVETWEEEGEPERMTEWGALGQGGPDRWDVVGTRTNTVYSRHETFSEARKEIWRMTADGYAVTAIPVRIPTETKRKVTLGPEPARWRCSGCGQSYAANVESCPCWGQTECPGPALSYNNQWEAGGSLIPSSEPTETGCRCREKVERVLDQFADEGAPETLPDSADGFSRGYCAGMGTAVHVMRKALTDCDCKARETP